MKKIIIVAGPTASGKTDLAVKIAKKYDGELINADSRQVYRWLDIGTNKGKVTLSDYSITQVPKYSVYQIDKVPIHLLSFLNPDQRFSAFDFKVLAEAVIENIVSRGKTPIVVGGTGFYIDVLLGKNYEIDDKEGKTDKEYRMNLELQTLEQLQQKLKTENCELYTNLNNSDANNPRRLVRLLEKIHLTTKGVKNVQRVRRQEPRTTNSVMFYMNYDWEELKKKIEQRVVQMWEEGLVDEVKKILKMGFSKDSVALQGIGYREVLQFLAGAMTKAEAIERIQISHRQYARRQRTWFEGKGRVYDLVRVSNLRDVDEYFSKNV